MSAESSGDPFVEFMSQHFVALVCEYETLNADGTVFHRGPIVFSGFLIELAGILCWVTAGHCLREELDDRIQNGQIRVVGGGLMDSFGYRATHKHAVPLTYEIDCGVYLDEPELGLDFGVIPLDSLKAKALIANNNKPITRENWVFQRGLRFEHYQMLGIPREAVFECSRADGATGVFARTVMLPIKRLDSVEGTSSRDWFVGQVELDTSLSTIKGMSGGPIYGFRRDAQGHWCYHAVALQSRWREESRIIFGCSVPLFAERLHAAVIGRRKDESFA